MHSGKTACRLLFGLFSCSEKGVSWGGRRLFERELNRGFTVFVTEAKVT